MGEDINMERVNFGLHQETNKAVKTGKALGIAVALFTLFGCSQPASDTTGAIATFEDVATDKVSTIALGNSDVPVGQYSQEIFTNLGIWDDIQSKISYGENVKVVLSQVEEGSVDCGVVYATDATNVDGVTVVDEATGDELTSNVSYPVAVTSTTGKSEAAKVFLNYLMTDPAKTEFENVGFATNADLAGQDMTFTDDVTLTVFAAASLTESLSAIETGFEEAYPSIDLQFDFNSSGTLETQIEQGAEADVFFSAAQKQMTALISGGYIDESTKIDLLENKVVLIVPSK